MKMKDYYLCNNYKQTSFYDCSHFNSFEEADDYFKNFLNQKKYPYITTSIIDVNSFIPKFLHCYVLNFKLRSFLVNVRIK